MKELRYIGEGRFIIGYPKRDIAVPDKEAEKLIKSGLYEEKVKEPPKKPKSSDREKEESEKKPRRYDGEVKK